ncbi:MAG: glutamine synthetase [Clostridium sp.]|uniref:glutamine synthetase n=1 Tax=Clostridium sp. TaxID=1506 RepID=UPI001E0A0C65|nr:glutamine synthetase [Clostridium sp.]MBS4803298.1 glutamine synthetase [Clostridium sp.]MBS5938157.1 glutamine synthetase [Clostridium sp.]MBS5950487.1 glutamine synthetase [Clostridium sp.]
MKDLIYTIPKSLHNKEDLFKIFNDHPEIKFVSIVGIDLSGNDTDEKIPAKLFLDDIDSFLNGVAIQTDGSSVVLPGIATLNDAKVDMIADKNANWFVDYNYDHIDISTNKPIGTLRIPSFLIHNNKPVCSRNILNSSVKTFKSTLLNIFKNNPNTLKPFNITFDDIDEIVTTSATELEFWVKTPNEKAHIEELSTSEVMQEQYWTRTKGVVRTALEETLLLMEAYGFEPEMGHKEVGGVKSQLDSNGQFNHIMEQLEIDWKYSDATQAADNEIFVKILTQETFRRHGLDVSFKAKPIDGVAGSGMHVHLGVSLKLKNGKRINLFHATKEDFLSTIGYGAIMGILKNYEIMNPFISSTNGAFKRLKPGFEAPICIVTSLGMSPDNPSRNRTILIGLIRDLINPMATRFELRSPNPHSNIYLAISVSYMAMLDGIIYALENNKTEEELLAELSKKPGEDADYLEKSRAYRTEEDVFEFFTDEERDEYFGKAPATVYENLIQLDKYPEKLEVLRRNDVFSDSIINSFKLAITQRWTTDIIHRIILNHAAEVRSFKQLHSVNALDLDISNWMTINNLRHYIMKDTYTTKSLFTRTKEAISNKDYALASNLLLELEDSMKKLRELYSNYTKNLLDI